MCGIVGYTGRRQAYPILIKGLHRLEYRGYDSAGVALMDDNGGLNVYKSRGKVEALEHFAGSKETGGTTGIAHTRWATHGEPNDTNAHPHVSQSGSIAIVHNGTIENYNVLKEALAEHGYTFRSETDTEVLVQLIDYIRQTNGCTLFEAVREATHQIVGAYAIAVIDRREPGRMKGTLDDGRFSQIARQLRDMPALIGRVLELDGRIRELSKIFTYAHNFLYLGRGYNYPTALEGALKLKEISYIHAEGYPAAEMKHGPIALVDNEMPTVVIATSDSICDKTVSNIQQVKARGGRVVAIVTEGDTVASRIADYVIEIPEVCECLSPLLTSVPLQLLAYYIAVNKGRDVDQPRNLAKSVTVE